MGKIIEKHQAVFGFMLGILIMSMVFGGIVYLSRGKDSPASTAYAVSSYPRGKATIKCLAIDTDSNVYLLRMDGKIVKRNKFGNEEILTGLNLQSPIYYSQPSKKVIAAIPAPNNGYGYYPISADGTCGNQVATGDYLGQLLPFQNGREIWVANTSGEVLLKYGIYPPNINRPTIGVSRRITGTVGAPVVTSVTGEPFRACWRSDPDYPDKYVFGTYDSGDRAILIKKDWNNPNQYITESWWGLTPTSGWKIEEWPDYPPTN